jgi:Common central domain of tyrosinase
MIPERRDIHGLTSVQRTQYAALHASFAASTGAVADHLAWHSSHGPGTDDHFLVWHRYFIRWLEDYLGAQGMNVASPVPYWPSNSPIPPELTAGTANQTPNVPPPTWTTLAGGATPDPAFGYTSLGRFKNTGELGRAIGLSYHGQVHQTVGGTMATFSSPQAPIFFPWHGFVDQIWARWQKVALPQPTAIVRGNADSPDASGVRINLFVRRKDGQLWERYWNGATWVWIDTGKAVFGRAAALVRGDVEDTGADDLRINLFVQGADRRLWERYWDGATWTWVDTGKDVDGTPLVIGRGAIGSPDASRLRVNMFVRGLDGQLWERYWNGSAWSWIDTGKAVAGDPIAVTRGSTGSPDGAGVRINLFVRGADGQLWERYWNGSAWSWIDTGKGVRGSVEAIVRGNRRSVAGGDVRINLFAEGTDGKLWERYWDGSNWAWIDTGKPAVGPPIAIVRGNADTTDASAVRINLFVPVLETHSSGGTTPHRHFDIRLWERYWNGASWTWVDTGKDIRSRPFAIVRGDNDDVAADDIRINLWVGGDDEKLWERYWNGAAWTWVDTGANVAI